MRGALRLAIVSNCATPRRFVDPALVEQGLLERMDAIVFSCEVGKVKPHPAIRARALRARGRGGAEALFVGDRVVPDVWGAGRLGMTTALARWFYEDEETDGVEPDFRLREPLELLGAVSRADPARPVVLVVRDGWGLAPPGPGNAVELASTPVFDRLWAEYPHTTLRGLKARHWACRRDRWGTPRSAT